MFSWRVGEYHSRNTQVHITINSGRLEKRRGSGNTPHVFSARGWVYLSPPPATPKLFNSLPKGRAKPLPRGSRTSPVKTRSKAKTPNPPPEELSDADAEGSYDEGAFNASHPFFQSRARITTKREPEYTSDSDSEDEDRPKRKEDYRTEVLPEKWNYPEDKFAKFYKRYMGIPSISLPTPTTPSKTKGKKVFGSLFNDDDDDVEDENAAEEAEDEVDYDPATDDTLIYLSAPEDDPNYPSSSSPPRVPPSSSPHKRTSIFPTFSSPQKRSIFPSSSPNKASGSQIFPSSFSSPSKPTVKTHWSLDDLPSPSVYSPNKLISQRVKFKQTPAPHRTRVERMREERVERKIERSKRGSVLKLKDVRQAGAGGEKAEEEVEEEKRHVAKNGRRWNDEEEAMGSDGDGSELSESERADNDDGLNEQPADSHTPSEEEQPEPNDECNADDRSSILSYTSGENEQKEPSSPVSEWPEMSSFVILSDAPPFLVSGEDIVESSVVVEQWEELNRLIIGGPNAGDNEIRLDPIPYNPYTGSEVIPDSEGESELHMSEQGVENLPQEESPRQLSLSHEDIALMNKHTTAIMKYQQMHDELWEVAKEVILTSTQSPEEALAPLQQYMSPDMCERLQNLSINSSPRNSSEKEIDDEGRDGDVEDLAEGLVPFTRQRKTKRFQSYRVR
ncbi:hypothetical protein NMY22_g20050 [Coprinellus aureogranulatus]|nr:hypothetical protein NMY22_g20050 [Coprinellus aureogranulatus]